MISKTLKARQLNLLRAVPSLFAVRPIVTADRLPGRNQPCACGSGKKFKKCCLRKHGDVEETAEHGGAAEGPRKAA